MTSTVAQHPPEQLKLVGVIPARLASTRFPRKVLFPFHGLPMVEHVRRRALLSNVVSEVIVATCDVEIAETIGKFAGKVIMTAPTHVNGTTRVAEAVAELECTHVMLLQGDEPLLLPRHMTALAEAIRRDPAGDAWNATAPVEHAEELDRHSFVKCTVSRTERVLYCFRRNPCYSDFAAQKPFVRKMLGMMAYRKDFLGHLAQLSASAIEEAESIEQMRILENGFTLYSVPVTPSLPSVNEPAEAEIVLEFIRKGAEQKMLLDRILW